MVRTVINAVLKSYLLMTWKFANFRASLGVLYSTVVTVEYIMGFWYPRFTHTFSKFILRFKDTFWNNVMCYSTHKNSSRYQTLVLAYDWVLVTRVPLPCIDLKLTWTAKDTIWTYEISLSSVTRTNISLCQTYVLVEYIIGFWYPRYTSFQTWNRIKVDRA